MRLLMFEGDSWDEYEKLRIEDKKAHTKLKRLLRRC